MPSLGFIAEEFCFAQKNALADNSLMRVFEKIKEEARHAKLTAGT